MTHGGDISDPHAPFARARRMLNAIWLLILSIIDPKAVEARFAELDAELARVIVAQLKAAHPEFADVPDDALELVWKADGSLDFALSKLHAGALAPAAAQPPAALPSSAEFVAYLRAHRRLWPVLRRFLAELHRRSTLSGRFYRRRRDEIIMRRHERRISSPRRRGLAACARAVPFTPINPAPP